MSFKVDFSKFNHNLKRYALQVPKDAKRGIRLALNELKLDADNVPPRTPHKEGHLRGSGKVQKIKVEPNDISGELKYGGEGEGGDVPYARKLHEAEPGTINWSEPDVGPKFVTSKIIRFMEKYIKIIATTIKEARG